MPSSSSTQIAGCTMLCFAASLLSKPSFSTSAVSSMSRSSSAKMSCIPLATKSLQMEKSGSETSSTKSSSQPRLASIAGMSPC